MKKFVIATAVFQIIFGIIAIISAIILLVNGENMIKWIGTIIVAILLIIGGILNLTNRSK